MRRHQSQRPRDDRAIIEIVLDNRDNPVYNPLKAGSIDGTDTVPHDHAVARAQRAHYSPLADSKIGGDEYKTLFVGRLKPQTSEETLRGVFSRWGPLTHVRLVRDIVSGASKGYAFVSFERDSDFRRAWRESHRTHIDGAPVLVEYERERVMTGWVPRRYGGGIGGRKESGQLRFGGRDRPFKRPFDVNLSEQLDPLSSTNREPESMSKMGVVMRVEREDEAPVTIHVKQQAADFFTTII